MNLSFSAKAGPLATIGFQLITLDQALQLATGAYGWYKARERTQSLAQLMTAKGASLVSTSTFSKQVYAANRITRSEMIGVVLQEGTFRSTALPKACTGLSDDPGVACLRALATGLLSFYSVDATTSLLADLIPTSLVQLDQDDAEVEFTGPLLAGLRQYVAAVAAEEDSDKFRSHLIDTRSRSQKELFQSEPPGVLFSDSSTDNIEAPVILGCLRWILTPLHKRDISQYPTRSLQAWLVTRVMEELGFAVHSSIEVLSSKQSYQQAMDADQILPEVAEVLLVTANVGPTDIWRVNDRITLAADTDLRPQMTPLRGVPWLAFRNLRRSGRRVNTQYLVDVWNFSYKQSRENVTVVCDNPIGHVVLGAKPGQEVIQTSHMGLLDIISPGLSHICGPSMTNWVPSEWNGSDAQMYAAVKDGLQNLRRFHVENTRDLVTDTCHIVVAIVLGTLYGITSHFCIDDGKPMDLDTEIAFAPDMLYSDRLQTLATIISFSFNGPQSYKDWNLAVLELLLGHKATDLASYASLGDSAPAHSGSGAGIATSYQLPIENVVGAQANGIAVALDLVVAPSLRPDAISTFHISRGQLLSLPVGPYGYVEASGRQERSLTMHLNPEPDADVLQMSSSTETQADPLIRIDAEPCWEGDPQTVVFRCRRAGVLLCPINISTIISRMKLWVSCACTHPERTLSIPGTDWRLLTIEHLTRRTFQGASIHRVDLRGESSKRSHVFVDASQSEQATIYALGVIQCQDMLVCQGCAKCLGAAFNSRWQKGRAVVVGAAVGL